MKEYLIIGIAFIAVYSAIIINKRRGSSRLNQRSTRIYKWTHYISAIIFLSICTIYIFSGIGLRGLWTTRLIVVVTLLTGLSLRFVAHTAALRKFESWYFKAFSWLPVAVTAFLFVPFMGPVITFSIIGQLIHPVDDVFYDSKNVRVQSRFMGVLGPPALEVVHKHLLFERVVDKGPYWGDSADSSEILCIRDSFFLVTYNSDIYDDSIYIQNDTISLTLACQ